MKLMLVAVVALLGLAEAMPVEEPETGLKVDQNTLESLKERIQSNVDSGMDLEKAKTEGKNMLKKFAQLKEKFAGMFHRQKRQAPKADATGEGNKHSLTLSEDGDSMDIQEINAWLEAFKTAESTGDAGANGTRAKRANNLNCKNHDGLLWDKTIYWDGSEVKGRSGNQYAAAQCAMKAFKAKLGGTFNFVEANGQCKSSASKKKNCMLFKNTPAFPNSCNGHSHVGRSRQDHPHEVFFSVCSSVKILCSIMQHELFHALGVNHEQSRADRDRFVEIHNENVDADQRHNFDKVNDKEMAHDTSYDYTSIMHYGGKTFSNNRRQTIVTKDKSKQDLIGEAQGLSPSDIYGIKMMYRSSCKPTQCLVPVIKNGKKDFDEIDAGKCMPRGDWVGAQNFGNTVKLAYCCEKNNVFSYLHSFPLGVYHNGQLHKGACPAIFFSRFGQDVKFYATERSDGSISYGYTTGSCPSSSGK